MRIGLNFFRVFIFLMMMNIGLAEGQGYRQLVSDSGSASFSHPGTGGTAFIPGKFYTNLQLGSFFTSTAGYGNSLSTFVSPTLSYAINPKLRFTAGISVINTNLFNVRPWYSGGMEQTINGNFTHAILSVGADYLFNEKLTLSGYLFKDLEIYNPVETSSPYKRENPEGGYIKVGYKVSENFHIEGSVGYSKGINPYGRYYGSPPGYGYFPY